MIRTKLFTRRLANVPWLLAAGLVLGWTPVEAAEIRLFVDRDRVREEAGRTEITVVAKNYDDSGELADVPEDTFCERDTKHGWAQQSLHYRADHSYHSAGREFGIGNDHLHPH